VLPIGVALLANGASKAFAALTAGDRTFMLRLVPALFAFSLTFLGVLWLSLPPGP